MLGGDEFFGTLLPLHSIVFGALLRLAPLFVNCTPPYCGMSNCAHYCIGGEIEMVPLPVYCNCTPTLLSDEQLKCNIRLPCSMYRIALSAELLNEQLKWNHCPSIAIAPPPYCRMSN